MDVLAVVPARGGSKGVPRKNIRELAGRPLLAYTAEAARAARRLTRIVLSTEDAEIAEVGRSWGLDVPFMRPAELARDDTPTLPVVQHAVRWLEEHGERYDAICLLQPTAPMRRGSDIDACIELLERSGSDAVVSMLPVPAEYNPHWVYFRDAERGMRLSTGERVPIPRRHDLPPAYHRDGSIYLVRRDVLLEEDSLYGERLEAYVMDPAGRVNIDTPADWARAERLFSHDND